MPRGDGKKPGERRARYNSGDTTEVAGKLAARQKDYDMWLSDRPGYHKPGSQNPRK